jgi:hypothetical protein
VQNIWSLARGRIEDEESDSKESDDKFGSPNIVAVIKREKRGDREM